MTTTRAHSPAEMIALLPYQFGYQPHRCTVLVCLDQGTVGLTARVDLPPPGQEQALQHALAPALVREAPETAMVIGYEERDDESVPAVLTVAALVLGLGIDVLGPFVVRNGACHPLDLGTGEVHWLGEALPHAADVPAVATFVGRGVAPLGSRDELAALLRPGPGTGAVQHALDDLAHRGGPGREESVLAWQAVTSLDEDAVDVGDLPEELIAVAAVTLSDRRWRDAVLARLCPGVLRMDDLTPALRQAVAEAIPRPRRDEAGFDSHAGVRARLGALVRRLPESAGVEVLAVLAHVSWWDGDGTMAREACDRAQLLHPGHAMTGLLLRLLDHGVRPDRLEAG